MKSRHIAAWFSGVALLGMGATLLWAQAPQPAREGPVPIDRAGLRAEVVRLRTEAEMLRLDYDLAREGLVNQVKLLRGMKMAGGLIGSLSVINGAGAKPVPEAPRRETEQEKKEAAEAAKAAEQDEKEQAAMEAALISEHKKELARLFALLAEKRLDLEDAERKYSEPRR